MLICCPFLHPGCAVAREGAREDHQGDSDLDGYSTEAGG